LSLDILDAIHLLYDEKSQDLKEDLEISIQNQEERKLQIKVESEKSKKRVLKIWRHSFDDGKGGFE